MIKNEFFQYIKQLLPFFTKSQLKTLIELEDANSDVVEMINYIQREDTSDCQELNSESDNKRWSFEYYKLLDLLLIKSTDYVEYNSIGALEKIIYLTNLNYQASVLRSWGLFDQFLRVNKFIINIAKKNEHYHELSIALEQRQIYYTHKVDVKNINAISENIERCLSINVVLQRSKFMRNEIITKIEIGLINIKKQKEVENYILWLSSSFKENNSYSIKSDLLQAQSIYFELNGMNNRFIKTQKKLLNLIQSKGFLYSINREFLLHSRIAFSNFLMLDFGKSIDILKSKIEKYTTPSINYLLAVMKLVDCTFLVKPNEIIYWVKKVKDYEFSSNFDLFKSKIEFIHSLALFLEKNYSSSIKTLDQLGDLEKDKEGWNIWIRVYRILCHIEEKKYDLVDAEIESFRKYMERTARKGEVRDRDLLVTKVILKLKLEAYDFVKLNQNHSAMIEALSLASGSCKWEVDSPEKILIHDWIKAKANGVAYEPDFSPYRKQQELDDQKQEAELKALPEYEAMGFELE